MQFFKIEITAHGYVNMAHTTTRQTKTLDAIYEIFKGGPAT